MVPGLVLTGTFSVTGVRKRVIVNFSFSRLENVSRNLKTVGCTLTAQVSLKMVQVSAIETRRSKSLKNRHKLSLGRMNQYDYCRKLIDSTMLLDFDDRQANICTDTDNAIC